MRDNGSFLVAKLFWAGVGVLDIVKPAGVLQAYSQIITKIQPRFLLVDYH